MIEGYIGVPGSGKTLSQTVRAYRDRRLYDEILTNYGVNFGEWRPLGAKKDSGVVGEVRRYHNANELLELLTEALGFEGRGGDGKRRLVLIDEVHLIFDARNWSKVPLEFLRILAQPRKARVDMLYTAQHESQVEKRLRIVTNYLHLCSCWGREYNFFGETPLFFKSKCYDAFEFRHPHARNFGGRLYRFKKRWGDLFDTMEVLDRMSMEDIGTKVSQALEPN